MSTLYIRNLSPEAAARIKRAAQVRGLTIAQYLERLSELHRDLLYGADIEDRGPHDWPTPKALLANFGLGRVEE